MEYLHEDIDPTKFDYVTAYRVHGNEKYLAVGETFEEVVARDKAILDAHGVTHVEVGQSLRKLLSSFNMFLRYRSTGPQYPCPGIKMGNHIYELGVEYCPYIPGKYSNTDWHIWVDGLNNGNKAYHPLKGATFVSDMLPEMIEQHGFFEGSVFYGIQPEWAIAVHKIVQEYDPKPYVPIYTARAWTGVQSLGRLGHFRIAQSIERYCSYAEMRQWWRDRGNEFPVEVIKQYIIHKEDIAGAVRAFVAPGNLELSIVPWSDGKQHHDPVDTRITEYWGLLVAYKDCSIPPDATLMGIPFDMYIRHFERGEMRLIDVFPYNEKQVG